MKNRQAGDMSVLSFQMEESIGQGTEVLDFRGMVYISAWWEKRVLVEKEWSYLKPREPSCTSNMKQMSAGGSRGL